MQRSIRPIPRATRCKKNINRGFSAPLGKRASGDDLQDRVTAPASFTPRPALWLSFGVENWGGQTWAPIDT
jgi:hypothetical protein